MKLRSNVLCVCIFEWDEGARLRVCGKSEKNKLGNLLGCLSRVKVEVAMFLSGCAVVVGASQFSADIHLRHNIAP